MRNKEKNPREGFEELERLSMPIKRFLKEHYNMNCAAVITLDKAVIVSTELSTPLSE